MGRAVNPGVGVPAAVLPQRCVGGDRRREQAAGEVRPEQQCQGDPDCSVEGGLPRDHVHDIGEGEQVQDPHSEPHDESPGQERPPLTFSLGSHHDARNQAAADITMVRTTATPRSASDCEPSQAAKSPNPNRAVTKPTRISGAQSEGFPVRSTRQISRWTIQSTRTNERAVKARAMPPTTNANRRLARDVVLTLATALASSPPMPAVRAASFGSWPAAVDASPKPVTMTKA